MLTLFHQLGFSPKEVKVLLALADVGKGPVSVIAKKAGVPRSTAYSILEALLARGLVVSEYDDSTALYRINQPGGLVAMVEAEKEEQLKKIARKEKVARDLEQLMEPLFLKSTHYSIPRIQFFEGARSVNSMLYRFESVWQSSIAQHDYTWWGYQDVEFVRQYRPWLDHYWSMLKPEERVSLLSNQSEVEEKLKGKIARRIIKQLPQGIEFSSTIWVLGEYVVTIMTRQKPHYAFLLKDSVFAANQRSIFQLLWRFIRS